MATSVPRHAEYALRTLFKRCLECADVQPSCPKCKTGETCIQQPGDGCNTCAQAVCVPAAQAGLQSSGGGGPNVGAIAGGVVGGVVFIAIVTFIIWRFCIRPRYKDYETDEAEYFDDEGAYAGSDHEKSPHVAESSFRPTSQARQSHHSVRSVASSAMTRASNVIQIAFIPGITDRSGQHGSGSDVPPVPSIPMSHQRNTVSSTASTIDRGNHPGTPDYFLTPADLAGGVGASRWSQFSNSTDDSEDIRSMRHHSLASSLARESVSSTIYHDGQTGTAMATPVGKAAVVSVRPSNANTPQDSTGHVPQVPAVDYGKYGEGKKIDEPAEKKAHPLATSTTADPEKSTGTDESEPEQPQKKTSNRQLAVAIEEATRRASRQPTHGGLGSVGAGGQSKSGQLAVPDNVKEETESSPFSDSNAVSTP
ncbi:MAG: hypothetical protein Q9162_004892 [Coniocarpon cinnabarinum]